MAGRRVQSLPRHSLVCGPVIFAAGLDGRRPAASMEFALHQGGAASTPNNGRGAAPATHLQSPA